MKNKLIFALAIFLLCFACGRPKELAGWSFFNARSFLLKQDGTCVLIRGRERVEARFLVLGSKMVLMQDDHGNTLFSFYEIDGDRLLGPTEHWRSGNKKIIFKKQ